MKSGAGVGFLNFAFEGFVSGSKWGSAVGVMAFILIVGGAFGIVLHTGAVENGILNLISKTKGKEVAIIPIMFCTVLTRWSHIWYGRRGHTVCNDSCSGNGSHGI